MILMDFSYFFLLFSSFLGGFGMLFGEFLRFQLLFPALFKLFGWVWGAVLEISAVSATFLAIFPAFGLNFRSCFGDFCSFSYFSRNFSGLWAEFWMLF